jgi:hypothetical protein
MWSFNSTLPPRLLGVVLIRIKHFIFSFYIGMLYCLQQLRAAKEIHQIYSLNTEKGYFYFSTAQRLRLSVVLIGSSRQNRK